MENNSEIIERVNNFIKLTNENFEVSNENFEKGIMYLNEILTIKNTFSDLFDQLYESLSQYWIKYIDMMSKKTKLDQTTNFNYVITSQSQNDDESKDSGEINSETYENIMGCLKSIKSASVNVKNIVTNNDTENTDDGETNKKKRTYTKKKETTKKNNKKDNDSDIKFTTENSLIMDENEKSEDSSIDKNNKKTYKKKEKTDKKETKKTKKNTKQTEELSSDKKQKK